MSSRTLRCGRAVASVAAIAVSTFITPAYAQQTAPAADDGQAIVVTGIRASLDASAALKRRSAVIVESVSAEDIGKLPDVSIADSLARLPGVTAQRLEGRDQRLSIRGLGPDFSTTLLNGREQVTVGDNRGVEYDQYPSEFFKNVVVYKAANPSLVAAGISGTVDLRMLRPLAQKNRVVAVQLRGQMNSISALNPDADNKGFRASAAYVDKFADDTFGIAIGLSATNSPSQNERYNAWGFPNEGATGGNLMLGGAKPYVQSNMLKRYGGVVTLEWQPNDNFHSTLDVLYSHFTETQKLRGIEFPIAPAWGSGATVAPGYTVSNGLVTDATVSGVHAVQRNDYNKREADNLSIGWNGAYTFANDMHLTLDASYSHAKRTDFLLETYTGTGYNTAGAADTLHISANPNGTFSIVPTLDYSSSTLFGITDPRGWGYNGTTAVVQAGFLNRPSFKDDLAALRASLDGKFGDGSKLLSSWEVGVNFSHRKKVSDYLSTFLCPKGATGTNCTVSSGTTQFAAIPSAAIIGTVPLAYLGVPKMLALDPMYLYNNSLTGVYDNRPSSLVRDNSVTEKVLTGYAMAKLDGDVGGHKLTGALGVQVVYTDQSSNGSISNFAGGVVTVLPAYGGAKYTNVLPSINLSYEISPATFAKFAASQTMVRPRMDQERVNQEFNVPDLSKLTSTDPANSPFSSTGGNPRLRPYKSTNLDVSAEHYFRKGGYVAVAAYYKRLTDYIDSNNSYIYDFSSAKSLLSPANQALLGTTLGKVSAPGNAGSGNLKGAEFTLSLPFSVVTPKLDGFGFYGSFSYTDSTIRLASNPGTAITLPGLSDKVANAEFYYEKHGFQTRVSYRYRSTFLAEVAGLSAAPTFRQAKAEGILDAQIGYEFQKGSMLQGLSVLFQAKNLTDRPFITYQNNDPRQVIDYQRYGRDYYLALSYKF